MMAGRALTRAAKLNVAISVGVMLFAAIFAAFIEYRHVYDTDNNFYPLCRKQIVSDCMLLESDSNLYVRLARDFTPQYVLSLFEGEQTVSLGVLNDTLLFVEFRLAAELTPSHPYAIVILLNALMFLGGLRNLQAIAAKLGVKEEDIAILYCLNPLMLFAITSLNKEIFGIYIMSAAVRAFLNRRTATFLFAIAMAYLTRFAFGVALSLLAIRYFLPRISLRQVLLLLLLGIPAAMFILEEQLSTNVDFVGYAAALNQRSAALLGFAAAFLRYPFGPAVTWLVVGGVDTISPIINVTLYPRYLEAFNADQFAQQGSSLLFTIFSALLAWRILKNRFTFTVGAEIFLYFFIVVATFPISAHRYLIAGWPYLALALLQYKETARQQPAPRYLLDSSQPPVSQQQAPSTP